MDTLARIQRIMTISMQSLGLFGNLLMFIVYYRGSLRKLSISVYFRWISVYSTINILCMLFVNPNWRSFALESDTVFKISSFLRAPILPTAVWFEVAASFDRFMTITFPFKSRVLQKRLVKSVFVASVIVYNIIFYLFILFQATSPAHKHVGPYKFGQLMFVIDLVNVSIVPFGLMLFLSIATFLGVLRAHRRIKSLFSQTDIRSRRKLTRDIKFGVTIITLNFMFLVCVGFYNLNRVFSFNPFDVETQFFSLICFNTVLEILFKNYFAMNFYVQLAVNSVVRKELLRFIAGLFPLLRRFRIFTESRS